MKQERLSVLYTLFGILFCVCLITANLLEIKVIKVGGLYLTGGLLIFPVSYIINDCITEVWGYKRARFLIWTGFAMNFFVMALLTIAVYLPADPLWEGGQHFNYVFGFAPRIVVASLTAFVIGSLLNTKIMSKMKEHNPKNFGFRAIVSTIAGETADSLIFFPIAFAGTMPLGQLLAIAGLQVLLKSAYEVLILPITSLVVRRLKR